MSHLARRLLMLAALVPALTPSPVPAQAPPLAEQQPAFDLQGHRGCAGLMPENSMPAFRRAIELGVTTIELDLQLTRDAVLAVHHDPRLDPSRCVGPDGKPVRKRPLHELKWEELEGVRCAGPRGVAVEPAPIPRLEQVLELAREAPYPLRLNLELKARKGAGDVVHGVVADVLVTAVREHGLERRVQVQSFDLEPLLAVRAAAPELPLGVIVRNPDRYAEMLERSGATTLVPRHDRLRERDVRLYQQQGIRVVPWTVNKPEAMRRMIGWGVDGMITDYPDRALEIIEQQPPRRRDNPPPV
jgi:glycerophosphoryl diester phosphodiesterase